MMPRTLLRTRTTTSFDTQSERAPIPDPSGTPFRIALLGDFGGRASRNEPRLCRDPMRIDGDNFDAVMDRLGAGLEISAGGVPISLRFRELDDFHPDHIYRTLPVFESLRRLRVELANPAYFRAAAPGLHRDLPAAPPNPHPGNLLDRILQESPSASPTLDRGASIEDAIRRIVAPHVIPKPDARQAELVGQVDAASSALMRAILSHPDFQALEAAWRSVFFLLRGLGSAEDIRLYVIDITPEEIWEATRSGAPQLIARDPWSAAACLHSFQPTEAELTALRSLAGLARRCGGPLLAGVDSRLVGCRSIAATPDPDDWNDSPDWAVLKAWEQLRADADARWLGLALPRILLRLPYGKETSPIEDFAFEEMPHPPNHEAYLWGSPATACVCLLGQAFAARGWNMHPGMRNQIDGLPVHNYRIDGEPAMTPAAETWLTDRAAAEILDAGLMPLASSKSTDAVLLMRMQSIASPPSPLAGLWDR